MSITISAVPFLLLYSSISIISAVKAGIDGVNSGINGEKIHLSAEQVQELLSKDFETQIMDTNTLIKTLEEHGAENIFQEEDNISCDCEDFHFEFYKSQNTPYFMHVTFKNESGLNELIENLNTEYRANAQEISYNKIKERLEQKNLSIDEEEIYDDNTIVLTVNLE